MSQSISHVSQVPTPAGAVAAACGDSLPLRLASFRRMQEGRFSSSRPRHRRRRAPLPAQVSLESCSVELPEADPGEAPAVVLPHGPADLALPAPARLRTGDIHSALFSVSGPRPVHGAPLGSLLVRWRRLR